jgi:hypothetical protein
MKTTIKTAIILSLAWILLVGHVVAVLNVTPSAKGTTWITWDWNDGSNTTDIFVDGFRMCGYETTIPSITALGFAQNSCHNISVFTDAMGNGTNISCTSVGISRGGGATSTGNSDFVNPTNILYATIGALVGGVIILGKFLQK